MQIKTYVRKKTHTHKDNMNWESMPHVRWLHWIFWGGYFPRLSVNYVGMSKDMGQKVTKTVLHTDENFLWSGFYCNRSRHGNVMTPLRFLFIFVFLYLYHEFFE